MKPLRRLTNLLAACAVTAAAFGQPALAADLRNDPVVQDLLRRENFDPGKKFHLFGKARGTVAERTGLMTISPTITQRLGNLQMETATIFSNPGYIVRFSGHGHEVHSPFDNSASKSDSWKGGKVIDGTGMTFASMSWDGYEHHPADGYDGPQGGGYPAPHGARDIYSYVAKGQVRRQTVVHDDNRSTQQRFADRFGNIPKNFSDRAEEANKKMFEHNPGLNRWGNSMEFINGVAAGALNPFLSAGEAIGVGDAVQGTGFAIDMATAAAISTMSPDNAITAIDHLRSLAKSEEKIGKTVRDWTAENPNAAETVEAMSNALPYIKAKNLTKAAKAGKADVSRDFSTSYTCSFHGSTLVKTADGYKAIARIRAGDRVFAKDEASGETGYKPVTARYGNPYQETVYIEVSDDLGKIQTLVSNRIHPFYSGGKWIKAEDLKAGSRLFAENGAEPTVQSVTVKQEPLQAYNLTVADWHTYFVKGDKAETEGVWVHNECPYSGNKNFNTDRPSGFRKSTVENAWDAAKDGSKPNTKQCPTCGKDVHGNPHNRENRNTKDGWDVSHNPSWNNRDKNHANRKELINDFNSGTGLECRHCNRSGKDNDSRFKK